MYLNNRKAIHDKPTATSIFNSEKVKAFSLRSEISEGCPTSLQLFKIVLGFFLSTGISSQSDKVRKRNAKYPNQKRSKTVFPDNVILYEDNAKNSTKKLSEWINEPSKFAEYKVKIQKSTVSIF